MNIPSSSDLGNKLEALSYTEAAATAGPGAGILYSYGGISVVHKSAKCNQEVKRGAL